MGASVCIPRYAPGFNFWESQQDAEDMCNIGTAVCVMEYEKRIGGEWECVGSECKCDDAAWLESANTLCTSLGDCGSSVDYLDYEGYYTKLELRSISGKLREEKLEEALSQ